MHLCKRFALERKKRFIHLAAIGTVLAAVLLTVVLAASARTTYVITDGSRILVHATNATDPEIVLDEAGLELGADDTYTTQASGGVSEINVHRSQRLTIDYYGERMEVTSQGETVEELLRRLNLSWQAEDAISAPLDALAYDGMELTVAHVVCQDQMYTAILPHETLYCRDASVPAGEEKVLTEGVDGEVLYHAAVTYVNGQESERLLLAQQVIAQPVHELIAIGSGTEAPEERRDSRMAVIGDGIITLPTGEVLTYTKKMTCLATAYHCEGYVGKTATGTRARVGAIAVDPEMFPYGTRFYIVTQDGEYVYGVATAEDCGDKRFIHDTRLDLFFNTKYECIQFGARNCEVYILG